MKQAQFKSTAYQPSTEPHRAEFQQGMNERREKVYREKKVTKLNIRELLGD